MIGMVMDAFSSFVFFRFVSLGWRFLGLESLRVWSLWGVFGVPASTLDRRTENGRMV